MTTRTTSDIGETIKDIISHEFTGFISHKAVSKVLGMSQNNWAMHRSRNSIPFDELLQFCHKYNVNPFFLIYGEGGYRD